jgi:DNA polymerase III sliding clamp (beta) subunit (PCNA family)
MSTTTQITVSKSALGLFLRNYKDTCLQVDTCNGMILLSCVTDGSEHGNIKYATICIGDHEGEDVAFQIHYTELNNYVRNANAKDAITFTVDAETRKLIVDSETIGEMQFGIEVENEKDFTDPIKTFDNLGEFKFTITASDAKTASTIADRSDRESSRYALGCVMFESGNAIATDGRRLALIETGSQYDEAAMVDTKLLEYAVKFGYEIDVFDNRMIAGDLILSNLEGRYPTWQQVIPDDAEKSTYFTGDSLRKQINTFIARNKAEGTDDSWGMELMLDDGVSAKVNAQFLKTAVGKLKSLRIAYSEERQGDSKGLTVPMVMTSTERPGWTEIIMPMAKDR